VHVVHYELLGVTFDVGHFGEDGLALLLECGGGKGAVADDVAQELDGPVDVGL